MLKIGDIITHKKDPNVQYKVVRILDDNYRLHKFPIHDEVYMGFSKAGIEYSIEKNEKILEFWTVKSKSSTYPAWF